LDGIGGFAKSEESSLSEQADSSNAETLKIRREIFRRVVIVCIMVERGYLERCRKTKIGVR